MLTDDELDAFLYGAEDLAHLASEPLPKEDAKEDTKEDIKEDTKEEKKEESEEEELVTTRFIMTIRKWM
jgi:hypothetical protein